MSKIEDGKLIVVAINTPPPPPPQRDDFNSGILISKG